MQRRMTRTLALLVIPVAVLAIVVLVPASPAEACSCIDRGPDVDRSDVVFTGVALEVARTHEPEDPFTVERWQFAVRRPIKGTAGGAEVVSTNDSSCTAGIHQ